MPPFIRCCARCHQYLPTEEFRRDSRGFWRSHCRRCQLEDVAEWRAGHRDELLARRREQYAARQGHDVRSYRRLTL